MEGSPLEEGGGPAPATASPPGEAEPGQTPPSEVQREKREGKERLPPSGPPQAKLNGGQPPAPGAPGAPQQFQPPFRSMMPPYVRVDFFTS